MIKTRFVSFFALLFYCTFYPFFILNWFLGVGFEVAAICLVLWLFVLRINKKKVLLPNRSFSICTLIMILFFLFRYIFLKESIALPYVVHVVFGWLGVTMLVSSFHALDIYRFFSKFISVMLISSFIGLFLYIIGLVDFYREMKIGENVYGDKIMKTCFFFNTKVTDFSDLIFVRTSGWFDEPGSFAFIIALCLAFNLMYINDKKMENKLLYLGCITLSAAHIAMVFFYNIAVRFNLRKVGGIILTGVLIYSLYITLPQDGIGGFIRKATFDRVENIINGTDKSRDFESGKDAAKKYLLFGSSNEVLTKEFPDATSDTIYYHIAQYGIFGSFIYFIYLIVGFVTKRNHKSIKWIICIFAMLLYQRPVITSPVYIAFIYYLFFDKNLTILGNSNYSLSYESCINYTK